MPRPGWRRGATGVALLALFGAALLSFSDEGFSTRQDRPDQPEPRAEGFSTRQDWSEPRAGTDAYKLLQLLREDFVALPHGALVNRRLLDDPVHGQRPLLAFAHVPKAGGSTVTGYLENDLHLTSHMLKFTPRRAPAPRCRMFDNADVVHGHISTRMAINLKRQCAKVGRRVVTLTNWREPLPLWESAFRWVQLQETAMSCRGNAALMPADPTIVDFSQHRCKLVSIPNFQSCWQWRIDHSSALNTYSPTKEMQQDCAEMRVDVKLWKELDVLVFTEGVGSLDLWLPALLGMDASTATQTAAKVNVNSDIKPTPLTAEARQRGEELLRKDIEIDRVLRAFYAEQEQR